MPMQKDQNALCEKQVSSLPAAVQDGGRVAQQVDVTPLTLQLFTARPCLLRPARYLFLDPFIVEKSGLSVHHFETAFPLPASVEKKTIKEKNQCILKQCKSQ